VNRMSRLSDDPTAIHLHEDTKAIICRERETRERQGTHTQSKAVQHWQRAAALALQSKSHAHYISRREHMSCVDCYDGGKARRGVADEGNVYNQREEDLPIIHPIIDGRLKDEGKS
jgi:5'-nucleotidase